MKYLLILLITLISNTGFTQEQSSIAIGGAGIEVGQPTESTNRLAGFSQILSPEQMRDRMRQGYDMQKEMTKMRIEIMAEPETVKLLAKFSRTYYEALIEEGFSKREAMELVVSVGIPSE